MLHLHTFLFKRPHNPLWVICPGSLLAGDQVQDAKIVITNSKVKHSLVDSAYNDRRNESEKALEELKAVVDIQTLGDLTEEQFEAHKDAIKDEYLSFQTPT